MHLLTHILSRVANDGADNIIKSENFGYFLLPDAIRFYSPNRKYSHFENDQQTQQQRFGMKYPDKLKNLSKESVVSNCIEVTAGESQVACGIGETTNIELFEILNKYILDSSQYNEVELHLQEDIMFDCLLRTEIDCSKRFEDIYFAKNGVKMDSKELRNYVKDMDLFLSASYINQIKGEQHIDIQNWINTDLYNYLEKDYVNEIVEGLAVRFNECISCDSWNNTLNEIIDNELYIGSDYSLDTVLALKEQSEDIQENGLDAELLEF